MSENDYQKKSLAVICISNGIWQGVLRFSDLLFIAIISELFDKKWQFSGFQFLKLS